MVILVSTLVNYAVSKQKTSVNKFTGKFVGRIWSHSKDIQLQLINTAKLLKGNMGLVLGDIFEQNNLNLYDPYHTP